MKFYKTPAFTNNLVYAIKSVVYSTFIIGGGYFIMVMEMRKRMERVYGLIAIYSMDCNL